MNFLQFRRIQASSGIHSDSPTLSVHWTAWPARTLTSDSHEHNESFRVLYEITRTPPAKRICFADKVRASQSPLERIQDKEISTPA